MSLPGLPSKASPWGPRPPGESCIRPDDAPQHVEGRRRDWWVAKRIYELRGLEAARDYQRIPFLDVRNVEPLPGRIDRKIAIEDLFPRLPFDRFAMELDAWNCCEINFLGPEDLHDIHSDLARDSRCLWHLDVWLYKRDESPIDVRYVIQEKKDGQRLLLPGNDIARTNMTNDRAGRFFGWAHAVIEAVVSSSSHLVEVSPTSSRTPRTSKTAKSKPWLRDDLPTVILISPDEARHYGHRVEPKGSHASPRPHQRRGHWKTLRSERYAVEKRGTRVWVRPAWIGDPEWVFQGNRYKVVQEVLR